jgi:antitoxin MazE
MKTQLAKWGNSLALRIPSAFAEEIRVAEGTEVDVAVSRGRLVITPAARTYSLEELVDGITAENRHDETDWGGAVGREVW